MTGFLRHPTTQPSANLSLQTNTHQHPRPAAPVTRPPTHLPSLHTPTHSNPSTHAQLIHTCERKNLPLTHSHRPLTHPHTHTHHTHVWLPLSLFHSPIHPITKSSSHSPNTHTRTHIQPPTQTKSTQRDQLPPSPTCSATPSASPLRLVIFSFVPSLGQCTAPNQWKWESGTKDTAPGHTVQHRPPHTHTWS